MELENCLKHILNNLNKLNANEIRSIAQFMGIAYSFQGSVNKQTKIHYSKAQLIKKIRDFINETPYDEQKESFIEFVEKLESYQRYIKNPLFWKKKQFIKILQNDQDKLVYTYRFKPYEMQWFSDEDLDIWWYRGFTRIKIPRNYPKPQKDVVITITIEHLRKDGDLGGENKNDSSKC